jgi:large subunit ribosomal protein L15
MPLYRRIARRGFSNYRFKIVYVPVNLSTLEQRYSNGDTVNLETLREHRVIGKHDRYVKILGNGELKKKLVVTGVKVSAGAQKKIEAAGGSVEGADMEREEAPAHSKKESSASDTETSENDSEATESKTDTKEE